MRSPHVLPVSSIPAKRGKEGVGIGIDITLTFVYSPADVSVNQCVTVPKMLDDTDTDTFFRY